MTAGVWSLVITLAALALVAVLDRLIHRGPRL